MSRLSGENKSNSLNISHNLTDIELEDYLEKALKKVKNYEEPNRDYPDELAEKIMDESTEVFDAVVANMISEIQRVINEEA